LGYSPQLIFKQRVTQGHDKDRDRVKYSLFPVFAGAYSKVESHPSLAEVNFDALQTRLIALVNYRIRNGEFTERGLARMLQVSQPQMHNVLKGHRRLQWGLADALLRKLSITIMDLINIPDQICPVNSGRPIGPEGPGSYVQILAEKYSGSASLASRKPPVRESVRGPLRQRAS
jgi:hypothetical protein